jgi:cytidylate kinase
MCRKVIFIIGNTGTGKTTLAKALAESFGELNHIEMGNIYREIMSLVPVTVKELKPVMDAVATKILNVDPEFTLKSVRNKLTVFDVITGVRRDRDYNELFSANSIVVKLVDVSGREVSEFDKGIEEIDFVNAKVVTFEVNSVTGRFAIIPAVIEQLHKHGFTKKD